MKSNQSNESNEPDELNESNDSNELNKSDESIDYFAMDWEDAKSFDDACFLMTRSITTDSYFDSFHDYVKNETNCVLTSETMPLQNDLLDLMQYRYLIIEYDIGISKINEINDNTKIESDCKEYMKKIDNNIENFFQVSENREYIGGFMDKNMVKFILPYLEHYIVTIEPAFKENKIKVMREYDCELDSELSYIFFPKNFDEKWPNSSCSIPEFGTAINNDYHLINLQRIIYHLKKDYKNFVNEFDDLAELEINDDFLYHLIDLSFKINDCRFPESYAERLNSDLICWMKENTYLITIISAKYGDNRIIKELTSCLKEYRYINHLFNNMDTHIYI